MAEGIQIKGWNPSYKLTEEYTNLFKNRKIAFYSIFHCEIKWKWSKSAEHWKEFFDNFYPFALTFLICPNTMKSGKNKYPRYLATRVLNFHWTYFGAISEARQEQKNQLKHKKGPYSSLSVLTSLTDTILTYVRAYWMFNSSVPSSNVPIGDNEFWAPFLCLYKQMAHVFLHSLSISNIPKWTCSRNINFEFSSRPRG